MSPALYLGALAVALASAKVLGHLFDRIKLPPILGQVLAGLILVSLPGPLAGALRSEAFLALSDLGLIFLLLVTGSESSLSDIRRAGLPAALVALGGVILPFALGAGAARWLGFGMPQALATGALFSPTSIGITAVTLLEAHRIRTRVGSTLIGAAILDDVLALGVLAAVLGTGSPQGVLLGVVVYFGAAALFGWKVLPVAYRAVRAVHVPEAPLTFVIVVALGLAALAETVGLAGITGAFVAGLAVRETMGEEKLLDRVHAVAYGVFIPLFFIRLGATLELDKLGGLGAVAPVLLAASFGGKFLGSAAGALGARMGAVGSLQVGIGMLPRMEVSLVVVAVATRLGVFSGPMADVMTGVALLNMAVSLVLTPSLLRASFRLGPPGGPGGAAHGGSQGAGDRVPPGPHGPLSGRAGGWR